MGYSEFRFKIGSVRLFTRLFTPCLVSLHLFWLHTVSSCNQGFLLPGGFLISLCFWRFKASTFADAYVERGIYCQHCGNSKRGDRQWSEPWRTCYARFTTACWRAPAKSLIYSVQDGLAIFDYLYLSSPLICLIPVTRCLVVIQSKAYQ